MKKRFLMFMFIATQILFVFLYLHKQTRIIALSYQKQKFEREYADLNEQKKSTTHELQLLKTREAVKAFAQTELSMQPMKLHQIKKIDYVALS